ncbi:hypothetical protein A3K93_06010 [Acinetobacter sp. NCu2D-2]|nr:hypothetical protein A3K93_06010 [Acinetobacter sp. NCu2D-2]
MRTGATHLLRGEEKLDSPSLWEGAKGKVYDDESSPLPNLLLEGEGNKGNFCTHFAYKELKLIRKEIWNSIPPKKINY